MRFFSSFLATVLLAVFSFHAHADIVSIDFEGFSEGSFTSGSEDGFDLLVTGGGPAVIFDSNIFPPLSGKVLASNTNTDDDTVLMMTETNGTTFSFRSLDGRWTASQTAQTITVEGFRSGNSVGTDVFNVFEDDSAATYMAVNLDGIIVDELQFTLTGRSSNPGPRQETLLDNIVISNVPEPNSVAMLFLLGGAVACRRRRQSRHRD